MSIRVSSENKYCIETTLHSTYFNWILSFIYSFIQMSTKRKSDSKLLEVKKPSKLQKVYTVKKCVSNVMNHADAQAFQIALLNAREKIQEPDLEILIDRKERKHIDDYLLKNKKEIIEALWDPKITWRVTGKIIVPLMEKHREYLWFVWHLWVTTQPTYIVHRTRCWLHYYGIP